MNRLVIYTACAICSGCVVSQYGFEMAFAWLIAALVLSGILLLSIASVAVLAAWTLVCNHLEEFSNRTSIAITVVGGLVRNGRGESQLPEVITVGGKLPRRLRELYAMPPFQMCRLIIESVGMPPCLPAYWLLGGA